MSLKAIKEIPIKRWTAYVTSSHHWRMKKSDRPEYSEVLFQPLILSETKLRSCSIKADEMEGYKCG